MHNDYISVTQLTKYIKYRIDNDTNLQEVYLKGEISNFKAHTRGHFYFTIKDENSRINAIMFVSSASKVKFTPEDGMKVLVTGKISVYEANGGYQIYVQEMTEDGVGNLHIAFEQLKKKLQAEGLFDPIHKQKIPRIPKRVGVITASTGAAIRDIISTIKRRFPICEILLFPSLVQGEAAKDDIVRQIKRAETYQLDVLIIGRGGGSIEDLWAFNEEIVATAIYNCSIPTISAVGHEIDFTIADFVADLRAPTPTAAAEIAVPSKLELLNYSKQLQIRAYKSVMRVITLQKKRLQTMREHYILNNPLDLYSAKSQRLDYLQEQLCQYFERVIIRKQHQLGMILENHIFKTPTDVAAKKIQRYQVLLHKLDALSPLKTLQRGYAIAKYKTKPITSIKEVKKGDEIELTLQDGSMTALIQ